jgi:hypothetical protein
LNTAWGWLRQKTSPLMSRLLEDLRDGRQDIVDDAATFGVDFRADGHARFKAKGPTVDGDFRGLQLDPGNVVKLCGSRDSVRLLASLSARNAGWVLQVCGSANGDGIIPGEENVDLALLMAFDDCGERG